MEKGCIPIFTLPLAVLDREMVARAMDQTNHLLAFDIQSILPIYYYRDRRLKFLVSMDDFPLHKICVCIARLPCTIVVAFRVRREWN
jgi:hypothetical protein